MAAPVRVLIADDQPLVRSGLAALLAQQEALKVVGTAQDGTHAYRLVRALRPDVVLMDIRMPGEDGLSATARILRDPALEAVRVVVLTTFDLDEYVFAALAAGASGFLLKNAPAEEIAHAIRVVAAGDALLAPEVTRRVIARVAEHGQPRDPSTLPALTERETQVVHEVAAGRSNTEIAHEWFVSEATVRTHVSRAMTKLGARDRAHLVVLSYQHGLATPPPQHPR